MISTTLSWSGEILDKEENMKSPGIYKIQSKRKPGRLYIGSAENIYKRRGVHLSLLKNKNHNNRKLQNHFNKYGKSDLVFSILIGCDKEDLIITEQFYIDAYNPWFNILRLAGSPRGYKHSEEAKIKIATALKGKKHKPMSDEAKRKISEANKNMVMSEEEKEKRRHPHKTYKKRIGRPQIEITKKKIGNMNKGLKRSEEVKKKMSESHKDRLRRRQKRELLLNITEK